jgi:hypothetical protein
MTTTNSTCPGLGVICPAEALRLSPDVGAGPSFLGRVPGTETGSPSLREAPGEGAGVSSLSLIMSHPEILILECEPFFPQET